jgi:WhiB family redox-sensing transcriptional regulator
MRVLTQHDWMKQASCVGRGELFYDEKSRIAAAKAKAICESCSVKTECLAYALENEPLGLWGGMTANERRRLRRRTRRQQKLAQLRQQS